MLESKRIESVANARGHERTRYQVIVIGGGQAGLCVGHYLVDAGIDVLVLEAATRIGESWRRRWDSLRLFTAAEYAGLPGLPFPGDPNAFPSKDEVADYLEEYARRMCVPVRLGTNVDALHRRGDRYAIEAGNVRFEADHVVVTTGPYQKARVPRGPGKSTRRLFRYTRTCTKTLPSCRQAMCWSSAREIPARSWRSRLPRRGIACS